MTTLNLQVTASLDDCIKYYNVSWLFFVDNAYVLVGGYSAAAYEYGSAMRFLNVTIPKNSTITAAYLTATARDGASFNQAAQWYSHVQVQDDDDPAAFSDITDFNARSWYATKVDWNGAAAWTDDTEYNSPSLTALIQYIVNLAGWASGQAMVLAWHDWDNESAHSNNVRACYSYDGSATKCVKLHIEYTPPVLGRSYGMIIG